MRINAFGQTTLLATAISCLLPLNSAFATDACATYTQTDAKTLLGRDVSEGKAKTAMLPAGQSCSYYYREDGDAYGMTVGFSTSSEIKAEGFNDSAADLMRRQIKSRQSGHATTRFRTLPDLGDESFWDGVALWVRKGDQLFIIKVSARLDGSFKSMAERNMATVEQNLSLSQQAAQTLLSRLK